MDVDDDLENVALTSGALRSALELPKFMINDFKEVCGTFLAISCSSLLLPDLIFLFVLSNSLKRMLKFQL